ncbi:sensor histidine kinase [Methylomagnum sp.]
MGRTDEPQRSAEQDWAERQKEELLAMLAHELRNPLAPLRNASALLRRIQSGEPKVAYACALIDRQVNYLSRLVDELLDVSRLLRGRVALKTELVDLRHLLRHAAQDVRQETRGRRQALSVSLPDGLVLVEGDYLRLLQAVEHLLNNASRYTKPEGDIFLELEATAAEVVVRVRDNGVGLSDELRQHIFELFAQGDRTLDRTPGGLGIGLSFIKRVVELHAGRIEVSSPGPGFGTEFTLRLPRWTSHPDTASSIHKAAAGPSFETGPEVSATRH